MGACPACAAENAATAKFCSECGGALGVATACLAEADEIVAAAS
jgi:predicted amidophosphoribosyltransferase